MATTYTITFFNNHGQNGNYCFFNQKPDVDGDTSDPNCFTNIWISKAVPNGDTIDITTTATYYAWTGTAPAAVAPGITIGTGKGLVATLGTDKTAGSTFLVTNDSGTPDIEPADKNTSNASAFEIDTGTDFQASDNFLVGLGLMDNRGRLVPSAVIPADQNMATNIMPIVKFYVSKNSSKQGTVVDFASESLNAGVMDFTLPANQGKPFVYVTHEATGAFTVTFSDQATFNLNKEARLSSKRSGTYGSPDVAMLQSKIAELEQLFKAYLAKGNTSEPDVNPLALYTATVGWLQTMTPAAINTAWGIIWNYLTHRGYSGSYTFDSQHFTTTVTITVVPKAVSDDLVLGAVPAYISTDWHNALGADSKDKPIDKGIVSVQKKAISDLKREARQYLQNQGIAANGY